MHLQSQHGHTNNTKACFGIRADITIRRRSAMLSCLHIFHDSIQLVTELFNEKIRISRTFCRTHIYVNRWRRKRRRCSQLQQERSRLLLCLSRNWLADLCYGMKEMRGITGQGFERCDGKVEGVPKDMLHRNQDGKTYLRAHVENITFYKYHFFHITFTYLCLS